MVYINDKKYACAACVKGHRSSSCKHTDRPLFEIKKKGRPVSQCEKCRELRQSKRMHSKCLCGEGEEGLDLSATPQPPPSQKKKKGRYLPDHPSLPNGISDAFPDNGSSSKLPHEKQRVDSLLNPCHCKNVWKCKCQPARASTPPNGLATLARAAAMCCGGGPSTSATHQNSDEPAAAKRSNTPPTSPSHKRHKCGLRLQEAPHSPGPDLPPILLLSPSAPGSSHSLPSFSTIPPLSAIKALAGSGCTCGLHCVCPGCTEHRGANHASTSRADCASGGCTTCIDWDQGVELPSAGKSSSSARQHQSIVEQFLATAAALPLPPRNRNRYSALGLDTGNVTVYPADLFAFQESSGPGPDAEARDAVFGLVKVPKLECCGGHCSCAEGSCNCAQSCEGRCSGAHRRARSASVSVEPPAVAPAPAVRSCCAR